MEEKMQLTIKNAEDRRAVVAILADNGYAVKLDRIKVGSQSKAVVVVWNEKGDL